MKKKKYKQQKICSVASLDLESAMGAIRLISLHASATASEKNALL